ncbi:MAG: OB-fold nucleic acid binding domain-containing protein [Candidatus Nanoarchaeia archaeon]
MAALQKRNTAYKLWISDLLNANAPNNGNAVNFFKVRDKEVHRVNIIANVVFKFGSGDNNYSSLTIDDGSGAIRLKAWREDTAIFDGVKVGDMVLVIGRPRSFNNEVYINPELIKVLDDPNWELVRKLELLKEFGPPSKVAESVVDELDYEMPPKPSFAESVVEEEVVEDVSETLRQKVLTTIENNSDERGIEISQLVKLSGLSEKEIESTVHELLSEGEIFEPRKGFLKVV